MAASEDCPICRTELINGDVFTKCGHRFHVECIEEWVRLHPPGKCPICRTLNPLDLPFPPPSDFPSGSNSDLPLDTSFRLEFFRRWILPLILGFLSGGPPLGPDQLRELGGPGEPGGSGGSSRLRQVPEILSIHEESGISRGYLEYIRDSPDPLDPLDPSNPSEFPGYFHYVREPLEFHPESVSVESDIESESGPESEPEPEPDWVRSIERELFPTLSERPPIVRIERIHLMHFCRFSYVSDNITITCPVMTEDDFCPRHKCLSCSKPVMVVPGEEKVEIKRFCREHCEEPEDINAIINFVKQCRLVKR